MGAAERMRAMGGGILAFITLATIGTELAEGRENLLTQRTGVSLGIGAAARLRLHSGLSGACLYLMVVS
jgi:hypothetical protein